MSTALRSDTLRPERLARLRAALPAHLERLGWDADRVHAHQEQALRALLAHARERSPFHAGRLREVDPDRFTLADLPSLPPMTKTEMMADLDRVLTDRRLSRAVLEDHLAATDGEARELAGGHVVLASGGSSGERGVFAYGPDAIVDYTLGLVRAGMARLLAAGPVPPGGVPMAIVAAASAVHASRALSSLFTGDLLDVTCVPVTLPIAEQVDRLNTARPVLLQGYPAALDALSREQAAGRLAIAPRAVTASSEQLTAGARARITEAFGVPVVNQFGSTEGVVGVSAPGEDPIVLASDLAVVELVDEDLRPVPPGETAARVLVTNLMNPVQPLIRYVLADRLTRAAPVPGNGHLRVTVEGREDDLLRYGDLVVHPQALGSVLVRTPQVVEYQVRQTPGGADVDVVAADGLDTGALAARLTSALSAAGLPSPRVAVRAVERIPRSAGTGKTARFVRLLP
jgi:phenylacetate-CoA ligase